MKKVSKVLAVVLTFVIAVACAACGGSSGNEDAKTIIFTVGTVETDDSVTAQVMKFFEEYVEENTGGRVDVQVHNNSVLGGERELLEGIQLGTIQLALPGSTQFEAYDKKFSILDVPFLFPSLEANEAAWSGELGDIYNEWLNEIGYTCYGIIPVGFRGIANNVHPVHKPDDLKGLKIRVMESKNYVDTFNLLGANTISMSYSEVYTALQQGTIDGQDNPPQFNVKAGFYEQQPYYTRSNHVLSRMLYIVSTDYMESLDPEIAQVIKDGLALAVERHSVESIATDEAFVQEMIDYGVEVTYLTDEEMSLFVDKMEPLHAEFRKVVGDEIFDLALSYSK